MNCMFASFAISSYYSHAELLQLLHVIRAQLQRLRLRYSIKNSEMLLIIRYLLFELKMLICPPSIFCIYCLHLFQLVDDLV